MLKEDIKKIARDIFTTVVEDRRHLHANPELSFQEIQTATFIKARLDEMKISWKTMAGTGVVAIIEGARTSNNVVALRADIDALPIAEKNQVSYSSNHEGVMHACGHDAHTASLLGTAFILQSLKANMGER
jgi:amidohydrolase